MTRTMSMTTTKRIRTEVQQVPSTPSIVNLSQRSNLSTLRTPQSDLRDLIPTSVTTTPHTTQPPALHQTPATGLLMPIVRRKDQGRFYMNFGKHSSRQRRWVYLTYPDYCDWALGQRAYNAEFRFFVEYVKARRREEDIARTDGDFSNLSDVDDEYLDPNAPGGQNDPFGNTDNQHVVVLPTSGSRHTQNQRRNDYTQLFELDPTIFDYDEEDSEEDYYSDTPPLISSTQSQSLAQCGISSGSRDSRPESDFPENVKAFLAFLDSLPDPQLNLS